MRKYLVALVVFAVLTACASEADNDTQDRVDEAVEDATSGPQTNSGNTDNPPTDDVALTECGTDAAGWVNAKGTITNHSSKPSTYFITVEFVAGGVRYAEGIASSSTVAPDQVVEWEASGVTDSRADTTCNLVSVERFAA